MSKKYVFWNGDMAATKNDRKTFDYRGHRCVVIYYGGGDLTGAYGQAEVLIPKGHPCYGKDHHQLHKLTHNIEPLTLFNRVELAWAYADSEPRKVPFWRVDENRSPQRIIVSHHICAHVWLLTAWTQSLQTVQEHAAKCSSGECTRAEDHRR